MNEQYIYLGFQTNTFFYFHTIANPHFNPMMSGEVYNVMIHESRITNLEHNVVIYELNQQGIFDIVIIQHESKKKQVKFDVSNLASFFRPLISVDRDDMYVISYDYEKGYFESYEIQENVIKPLLDMMPDTDIPIGEIRSILSRKAMLNK